MALARASRVRVPESEIRRAKLGVDHAEPGLPLPSELELLTQGHRAVESRDVGVPEELSLRGAELERGT